jgi:hypothetical protein
MASRIHSTLTEGPAPPPAVVTNRIPGEVVFFAITHGLMLLFGGLAILVAQGVVPLGISPLALVALGGTGPVFAAIAHAAINLTPEPWAAARLLLPVTERGPYPSALIAAVWVTLMLIAIAVAGVLRRVQQS